MFFRGDERIENIVTRPRQRVEQEYESSRIIWIIIYGLGHSKQSNMAIHSFIHPFTPQTHPLVNVAEKKVGCHAQLPLHTIARGRLAYARSNLHVSTHVWCISKRGMHLRPTPRPGMHVNGQGRWFKSVCEIASVAR